MLLPITLYFDSSLFQRKQSILKNSSKEFENESKRKDDRVEIHLNQFFVIGDTARFAVTVSLDPMV